MTAPLSLPLPLPLSIPFSPSSDIHHHHSAAIPRSLPPPSIHPSTPSLQPAPAAPTPTTTTPTTIPSPRTSHAPDLRMFEPIPPSNLLKIYKGCSNCRTQKIKCNGQEPCARCRAFGLQCQYIVLPNQAAHRLAALAASCLSPDPIPAAPATSTSGAAPVAVPGPGLGGGVVAAATLGTSTGPGPQLSALSNLILPGFSSTSSPTSSTSSISSNASTHTRGGSRRKQRITVPPRRKFDQARSVSSSPLSTSPPETTFSPATMQFAQSVGIPNVILHTIIETVDQEMYNYPGSPKDESGPDPKVMRHLVGLYLRYAHPLHRIVDENDPNFWTRMDEPMAPEVASIVYAMCTVGAIFKSKAPGTDYLDDMVFDFYRRTLAIKEERSEDIVTVQTLLIIQNFFAVTLQAAKGAKFYIQMLRIADTIKLGETVQKISTQETLSASEVMTCNTWRVLVWTETLGNMISLQHGKIDPLKDLASPALIPRPEEVPNAKSPTAEVAFHHLSSLFKIFQDITKIKLPMSPRDLHPVTTALDALAMWHNSLPKNLRSNPRTGGTAAISSHASNLDLYYRLGHVMLLNSLPPSVRSSPTGLGPRRESPLRILATCANGITGTMGDMIKEPDLRSYCIVMGMRCLTEAATIQLANSKEPDPAISTPAKVNFMKTLWCIKQMNFAVSTQALGSILATFDATVKQGALTQRRDKQPVDTHVRGASRTRTRTRTPSFSATSEDSSTFSAASRGGREHSMPSDYSSSTASTREGSHMTIYETDDAERERFHQLPASPSQDGAAASLLALSLESPIVGQQGPGMHPNVTSRFSGGGPDSTGAKYETMAPELSMRLAQRIARAEAYEGDSSRSSSVSIFSPKIETPAKLFAVAEAHSPTTGHHRSVSYSRQASEYESPQEHRYSRPSPGLEVVDADPLVSRGRASSERSWQNQRNLSGEHGLREDTNGSNTADHLWRTGWADPSEVRTVEHGRSPVEELGPVSRPLLLYGRASAGANPDNLKAGTGAGTGGLIRKTTMRVEPDALSMISTTSTTVVAGRKRPSTSMYAPIGQDEDIVLPGNNTYGMTTGGTHNNNGGGMRGTSGEIEEAMDGDGSRVRRISTAGTTAAVHLGYNADPFHQDGADAVRLREVKREDPGRSPHPHQHYGSESTTMQTLHPRPIHHPQQRFAGPMLHTHPDYLSPSSPSSPSSWSPHSQISSRQHPPYLPQQQQQLQQYSSYRSPSPQPHPQHYPHPYQNQYQYHHQETHPAQQQPSQHYPYSRHQLQHHELRSSPLSSHVPSLAASLSTSSSSSSLHLREGAVVQPPGQELYGGQEQGVMPRKMYVRAREDPLVDGRDRREPDRGAMMPPLSISRHGGGRVGNGENGDEDSAQEIADLLREPIRRKYR